MYNKRIQYLCPDLGFPQAPDHWLTTTSFFVRLRRIQTGSNAPREMSCQCVLTMTKNTFNLQQYIQDIIISVMIVHLRIILLLQGYQRESNHAVLPYFDSVSGMSELHTCIQSPLRLLPLKQVRSTQCVCLFAAKDCPVALCQGCTYIYENFTPVSNADLPPG